MTSAAERAFVRGLRARVRAKVRADPALRAEKKRVGRRRQIPAFAFRILVACVIVPGAMSAAAGAGFGAANHAFTLWLVAIALFRAQQIAKLVYAPENLIVPYHLPITDDAAYAMQRRMAVRDSYWVALDCVMFGLAVETMEHMTWAGWLALPLLAIAQWATTFATGAALAWWFPSLPFAAGAGLLLGGSYMAAHVVGPTKLEPVLSAMSAIAPMGWVQRLFERGVTELSWLAIGSLALVAVAGCFALTRLAAMHRRRFRPELVFGYASDDAAFGLEGQPEQRAARPEELPFNGDSDPAAVRLALHRELSEPAGLTLFSRGFLERWITRALDSRSRVVVDFLQPHGFSWTKGWLIALTAVVGGRVLGSFVSFGTDRVLVGALAAVVAALFALPFVGGAWLGMSAAMSEQVLIGLHAYTPLGFWRMGRTMLAVCWLRVVAALPLALLAAMFCFTAEPLPFLAALDYAFRFSLLVAAMQPVYVVYQLAQNTNDTSARWWLSLVAIFTVAVVLVGGVTFGVVVLMLESPLIAYGLAFGLIGFTLGILGLYGLAWNGLWFDLAKLPRR